MNAIAQTQRHTAQVAEPDTDTYSDRQNPVVESSGDLPWAEFCKDLNEPAFLLAVTGFGDLEQS